jgi:hypothetical protein
VSVPRVYAAITAVIGELSTNGIGKRHVNARDRYDYRSVDDLYERLSPLLAKHRLCVLPRILKRSMKERTDEQGQAVASVTVQAAFDVVSAEDGSRHVLESFGEAYDASDKATAKAMTAAYKYALFQAFCIPSAEAPDADADSVRLKAEPVVEPVPGWTQWAHELLEAIASCETFAALEALQASHRDRLRALAMHEVAPYGRVGEAIRLRRQELSPPGAPATVNGIVAIAAAKRSGRRSRPQKAVAHA